MFVKFIVIHTKCVSHSLVLCVTVDVLDRSGAIFVSVKDKNIYLCINVVMVSALVVDAPPISAGGVFVWIHLVASTNV